MNTREYKIGDLIDNKYGLELEIQEIDHDPGESDVIYRTVCTKCGYIFEKTADSLIKQKICTRCLEKHAAVKFDANGTCISINGLGLMEFIIDLTETHDLSDPEAIGVLGNAMANAKQPVKEESTNEN